MRIFFSACSNFQPTNGAQCALFPISGPAFVISGLFNISRSVKWHLIVVLICTSLMNRDIEHIFLCLLTFHISSGLLGVYLQLSCMSSLYFLKVSSLPDIYLAVVFLISQVIFSLCWWFLLLHRSCFTWYSPALLFFILLLVFLVSYLKNSY